MDDLVASACAISFHDECVVSTSLAADGSVRDVRASEGLQAVLGRTFAEFVAEGGLVGLVDEPTAMRLVDARRRLAAREIGRFEDEVLVRLPDGSGRWLGCVSVGEFDDAGRLIGIHTSLRDVSERRGLAAALALSEARRRSLLEHLPIGVVAHEASGQIFDCNDVALELLGLTREQMLGRSSLDPDWQVIHEDGTPFPGEEHPAMRALATRLPVRDVMMGVARPRTRDRVWLLVNAMPVLDERGRMEHVLASFADITPLRESEERFRAAFESSGSGMLLMAPDLRVSRVNPALCNFLGRSAEELGALRLSDVVSPADHEAIRRGAERLLRGEIAALHLEAQFRHSSGRPVWGSISSAAVKGVDGAPIHLVTQVQDVTYRKRAEAEKRQLELQLLQAQKMDALGTLAGGVAHEFNNILATILGNVGLLRRMIEDRADAVDAVQDIAEVASRGAELVQQILTFSRRSERRVEPVRLERVMQQSLRMLRAALPPWIALHAEIPEGGPLTLADAAQIQQVLTNLTTNAWHAMEVEGGTLSVGLSYVVVDAEAAKEVPDLRAGLYARIRVSDTGHGMDEETLSRIFEPFFTTKPVGKGTGLGLPVVHGIVHGHGGAIRVRSARGSGTTFEVFLPTAPEHAEPEPST